MRVAEIFYSIQGEGKLTGIPSVFIRASGCNLRCRWCDTPYASWQPEGEEMNLNAIEAEVLHTHARHVVMTGGEPMLARGVHELMRRLKDAGLHITIETAATLPPDGIACDLASLSPKLRHSTPPPEQFGQAWHTRHEQMRWQPEVLRSWVRQYDHQIKFVVTGPEDLVEIETFLVQGDIQTAAENILLMPEGRTVESLHRLAPQLVEWCKQRGWRYCARLHIDLFGNKRGT